MTTADQIVAYARSLCSAQYRHLGRGPFGFDCLGVVLASYKGALAIPEEFDFTDYSQNVADYELEQYLNESGYLERLKTWKDAQPGDILLQRFHTSLPASHLIVISIREGNALWGVHASNRTGTVVEQRVAHLERNVAAYRLKGVPVG